MEGIAPNISKENLRAYLISEVPQLSKYLGDNLDHSCVWLLEQCVRVAIDKIEEALNQKSDDLPFLAEDIFLSLDRLLEESNDETIRDTVRYAFVSEFWGHNRAEHFAKSRLPAGVWTRLRGNC